MAKVYSGVDAIDGLLTDTGIPNAPVNSWSQQPAVGQPVSLTYDWMSTAPSSASAGGFRAFGAAQQDGAERAMDLFADVANVTFQRQPAGEADIEFGTVDFGGSRSGFIAGAAFTEWTIDNDPPNAAYAHADIYLTNTFPEILDQTSGGAGFTTMLHEVGHALGLDHTFDNISVPAGTDSEQYSIMSYDGHPDMNANASTPLLYDIAAIQYLYGANMTTRTGDDVYTWTTDASEISAIWDAGGNDTIDASNQVRDAVINLEDGAFSSIGSNGAGTNAVNNVAIAYGATIENANGGSGNDTLDGNETGNRLYGRAGGDTLRGHGGNDVLNGGTGGDQLAGGAGDDRYWINSARDSITETADNGYDRAHTSVDYALTATHEVEVLTTNNYTASANIDLTGNQFAQTIIGNMGDNRIDGGGGADKLRGFDGNDTFVFSSAASNGNIDTIIDFDVTDDQIELEDAAYAALSSGALAADAFRSNTTGEAEDADDHIIYDRSNGNLYYDSDGAGGQDAVQFASVSPGTELTHEDIEVI